MARPLVFSFINEQKRFLFLLVGFLTFLSVVSGGIVLSISSAISRFSSNIERTGIIQATGPANIKAARAIVNENSAQFVKVREIDKADSAKMLKNWLRSAEALSGYIPEMIEVQTKTTAGLDAIAKKAEAKKLRFVYSKNAGPERGASINIMIIAGFIFFVVLSALAVCVIHSVKNIIMIHKREIEILNQIGATTGYISWQIQKAMMGLGGKAVLFGTVSGWAMLGLINGIAGAAPVGIMANMGMERFDWAMTGALAVLLVISIAFITGKTTVGILK